MTCTSPLPDGLREIADRTYSYRGWRIDYDPRGIWHARKGHRQCLVQGDAHFMVRTIDVACMCDGNFGARQIGRTS